MSVVATCIALKKSSDLRVRVRVRERERLVRWVEQERKMPPPRRMETTGENSSSASSSKSQHHQSSSSRDEEEDIISSLPEAILHKILSFLDMKHAVQTSILSKRWTDLWASLGSLTFNSQLFYLPTERRCVGFHNFVDQVSILRDNSDIDKFHLIHLYKHCEIKSSRFNTWIISVIKRKVQRLYIEVRGTDGLRLPNRLFTCNSLTRMMLALPSKERWSITLPPPPADSSSSMCLPNLLILQLCSVSFNDETLTNNFFLSCPNLKHLFMYDVEFLNMNINISALKLMGLEVDNHGRDYGYCHWPNTKFNLHAPDLTYFRCTDFLSRDYIMGNLPSLVKANIDMKVEVEDQQHPAGLYSKLPVEKKQMYAQRMMQCLRALRYVEDLKLSAWFFEVISGSLDLLKGESTELCDLTCLRLITLLSVDTIRAISYLLKISPNIKSLFLEINQVASENVGSHLEAEMSFQCLLDKLEIVEIQGAVGCADELNFLEVLLKNANALKKLVVCTSTESSPDSKEQFRKFSEKLLMFPRASSNISILFY